MKSQSNSRTTRIKTLVILPILALLVYGFSSREIIPLTPENEKPNMVDQLESTEIFEQDDQQKSASREQMKEYNDLARKYNGVPMEKRIYKLKEIERMKYIYGLMSDKQRKSAEPFPNIPPKPKTASSSKNTEARSKLAAKAEYAQAKEMKLNAESKARLAAEAEYTKSREMKLAAEATARLAEKEQYQKAKLAQAEAKIQYENQKDAEKAEYQARKLEQQQAKKDMAEAQMSSAKAAKLEQEKMKEEKMKMYKEQKARAAELNKQEKELKLKKIKELKKTEAKKAKKEKSKSSKNDN